VGFLASFSSLDFVSFFESFVGLSVEEVLSWSVSSFGGSVKLFHKDFKKPLLLGESDEGAELEELSQLEGST
jgi:hypothetical protein